MNNIEFNKVLEQKRHLAVELVKEYLNALNNKENRAYEALLDYYNYVHDAVYATNAPQSFMEPILDDIRLVEVNESRFCRFWAKTDAVDELADKLWLAFDIGEFDCY